MKSVYQTHILAFRNLANSNPGQECGSGRCLSGMIYVFDRSLVGGHCHIIRREASALLFLPGWANARASKSGESKRYRLSRFFYFYFFVAGLIGKPESGEYKKVWPARISAGVKL